MRAWLCAVLGIAVLFAGACGSDDSSPKGLRGKDIEELDASALPNEVLGMAVSKEKITDALADARGSYVEGASLYAFRAGDLLQATLQVSKFSAEADPESAKFRSALISQIGGTQAQQVRIGKKNVYLTRGNRQRIAVWFKNQFFYVLSTREDFDRPRGLLREVLELPT